MLAFSLFNRQLEYALGWMVLHSLWQGMAIALLTGVLLIALRHRSAQLRYIVANFGLFAVMITAGFTFYRYYATAPVEDQLTIQISPAAAPQINTALLDQLAQMDPAQPLITEEELSALEDLALVVPEPDLVAVDRGFNWPDIQVYFDQHLPLIVGFWLLGVAIFLLRLLSSVSYVYYLKGRMNFPADEFWLDLLDDLTVKTGLDKAISLVESALVRTPQVVGYLKPMILFPLGMINRLPAAEVEAILAHELAHILRHDHLLNVLQGFVETLFYYHPGVWWISAQVRTERESAADELAIQLTGDSLTYAKALVTVQEMGFMPMSPALAFAGQQKSQFMLRLQRILHIKSPTTNTMEKMLTVVLVAGTLSGLAWIKNFANNTYHQVETVLVEPKPMETARVETTEARLSSKSIERQESSHFDIDSDAPMSTSGFWNAEIKGERVYLNLQSKTEHSNWNTSRYFDKKEFSSLPTTESTFHLKRDAGTLNFKGKFDGNEGYGKFDFAQNAEFKQYLDQQSITGVDEEEMLHLFMADVNKDYIAYLQQHGYKTLTGNNLVEMSIHGLDKETLQGYFAAFQKGGYGQVPIRKLIELKIHGAGPSFMQSLTSLGYEKVSLEDVLTAKIHGISADYVRGLQSAGYSNLPLEQVVTFKIHGVDADYARRMNQANGGKNLSADELVSSKIHGLDPERINKIRSATGGQMSMEDMRSYSIHGIDDAYIQSLKDAGFASLKPQAIIQARIHGLDGVYMKSLKEAGFSNLSLDQAMQARIHGLNGAYMKSLKEAGFSSLSLDQAIQARIHGLEAAQIKAYHDLGFKSIDLEEAISLKIHGVSPEFIQRMREKGFKDLDLDDYVKMKIHGIANGRNEK